MPTKTRVVPSRALKSRRCCQSWASEFLYGFQCFAVASSVSERDFERMPSRERRRHQSMSRGGSLRVVVNEREFALTLVYVTQAKQVEARFVNAAGSKKEKVRTTATSV
jgi:hypothetical protein